MGPSPSPWRRPPLSRLLAVGAGAFAGIATALVCNQVFHLGSKTDLLLGWFAIGAAPLAVVLWDKLDLDRGRRRFVVAASKVDAYAASASATPYGPNSAQVEAMLAGLREMSPDQVTSFSNGVLLASIGDKTILTDARRGSVRRSDFLLLGVVEEQVNLALEELWASGSWSDGDRRWVSRAVAVVALRPRISSRRFYDFWAIATRRGGLAGWA